MQSSTAPTGSQARRKGWSNGCTCRYCI